MEATVPDKDGTPTSLWEAAFDTLSAEDKEVLEFTRTDVRFQPSELMKVVEKKKQECLEKQWSFTNKAGKRVLVRDVLAKVVDWIEKFKQVGDVAVQYDPGHAAIPWAAVMMLLQVTVNDTQTFGTMAEGLERISSIVALYTHLEAKVLIRNSVLTSQLSTALVKLYGSALRFLANACRYYAQSTLKRTLKSIGRTAKMTVEEPMLRIEEDENAVYKLLSLVQNESSGLQLDDILGSIKQSVESFYASNEERSKRLSLSTWINGIDTKNTYEAALQNRHEGTCEWVLRLDRFRLWASGESGDSRLLWIHGPPGFGKTFMSARIIQHLSQAKNIPLSYFFCMADSQATRDPYAILRSWLAQMLGQDQSIVSVMDSVHKARKREQTLTHSGLWQLFVAVGSAVDGCTFVVDGFDECVDIDTGARYHHGDPRNLFLRDLVINLAKTKSRVLVVSRDVPDIREYLGKDGSTGAESCVGKLEYGITSKDTTADVESFSEHMVNTKLPRKKAELRHKIAAQAAERSEGMFLWIKLLEQTISPGQNAKQLVKTVAEMPSGISEAYSSELEKIVRLPPDEKDQAVMILRWTLFAIEPLQVKELAEALVVSGEELEEYPYDDLPDSWCDGFVDEDYVKEMILGRCGSLLQLKSTSTDQQLADYTVHFVHFSAKEYLSKLSRSTVISNQWAEDLGLGEPAVEEARISSICLRYLTLSPFEDIPPNAHVYPFLSYAAWAWYLHSFRDKPTPSQNIMHLAQRVFDPNTSRWRVWTPLMEARLAELKLYGWRFREADTIEADQLIYYASLLGLTDVVCWLEDQGLDCSCVGGYFGFPLQAAVVSGQEDLVRHLLNRGVNASQAGGHCGAAIIAAVLAVRASSSILQMLLEAGADPNAADGEGWTALHYATACGDLVTVRHLVARGADPSVATTKIGHVPLSRVAEFGDIVLIEPLVNLGAHFDDRPSAIWLSLIMTELLLHFVPITKRASVWGRLQCTRQTAFDLATTGRCPEMLELLVQRGCFRMVGDNDKGGEGSSAPVEGHASDGLVMLAYRGDFEGVKVLLSGQTRSQHVLGEAMNAAAARGHVRVVDLFLRHGARPNLQDINGRTALHHAARYLHGQVAGLLIEHGAGTEIMDLYGSTPIDPAILNGNGATAFIWNRLDDFPVAINRRLSLLTPHTPDHTADPVLMGVRRAITGRWEENYQYRVARVGPFNTFFLEIPPETPEGSRPSTFSMVGKDRVGPFYLQGFVDFVGAVWFVKLYQRRGWLYRGEVLKGTRGSNRKRWFWTFDLRRMW